MEAKRLMKVTYQDLKKGIRLNAYADAVIWSEDPSPTLAGLRFGGYAEVVRGLTDAIYGGATIEIEDADGSLLTLKSLSKQYHREVSHEGLYAEATLIAEDEIQESSKSQDEKSSKHAQKDDLFDDNVPQQDIPAHICYIFCHPGNEDELFQAIDQKSYVPMIPEYQDYVLAELKRRRILRPLRVRSLYQELEAWKLCCEAKDQNLVKVMEDGLKQGKIKIPGAAPGPSLLDGVHSVTDYLNTFGVAVAERIKKLFVPLFDPATEPLSEEVLDINEYIRAHAGYSLYDAQLAVAESIKRKLGQSKVALIVAGCGTGKTKIGSVAVAAAGLQSHQISAGHSKTFSIVLCPAHVTKKWVREIEESIPNTFAAVVRSISEFDLLYKLYEQGSRNCFAIISKEKARDGYMRAPAVIFRKWNREGLNIARPRANEEMPAVGFSPLRHVFCCPDCGAVIMENISKDGVAYCVPAGPRFFRSENRENHKCKICGSSLWTALNPTLWNQQTQWAKLGSYGFVFRPLLNEYREDIPNEAIRDRMTKLANCPDIPFPIRGAYRTFPLSSYIKRAYKGKIFALIADELHQYNNNSGQGDAMQELLSTAKKVVGMTATLVNGYTPKRLLKLVTERGWNATILEAKVKPEAREDWVQDRLDHGLQVLIGNPSLVETGLDLNAFTTLIFYDTGYKLFTLRQASLRSWRINQSAPRVEVYMLYHAGTMQHKAIKLMASKLAAAGMIEGSFSEEGLSAMSECEDMTTLMARELMMGIKDSVEDLAATFKRMAMLKPQTAAWSIFSDEVRKTDSAVLGRSSPSILEFTFGTEERTVPQAAVLPQDSPVFFETAKAEHKRKKGEVDEDQLLLFQIA